jgi:hypothetical protein
MSGNKERYILCAFDTEEGHLCLKGPIKLSGPFTEEDLLYLLSKDPNFCMAWFFREEPSMSEILLCMTEGKGIAGHKLCTGVVVNGNTKEV